MKPEVARGVHIEVTTSNESYGGCYNSGDD